MVSVKKEDANRIAIVAVGYNRLNSIKRLLGSLLAASYEIDSVPLVISIDCSGDTELYEYVENFNWPFGNKYVQIQQERLGLKEHIYRCGDLSRYFRAIVLLEDDIFVSPYFYSYTNQALLKYSTDNRIAQISLYRNEIVGQVGLPFILMPSSSDVFLMQAVSTWGECWTYSMWQGFREWLQYFDEKRIDFLDMPETYKRWTKAWSKYYNAYLLDTNKYVIYPYTSLTTNFNEAGEHASASNSIVQVVLQQSDMEYRMENYDLLVKYDIFRNNQNIYDWIKIPREDVLLDIYGYHEIKDGYKYLLTSKKYPFKAVKAYAAKLTPIELNLKYDITGSGVYLYELPDGKSVVKKPKYHKEFVASYLNKYNAHVLIDYMSEYIKRKVIARFK